MHPGSDLTIVVSRLTMVALAIGDERGFDWRLTALAPARFTTR